MVSGTILITHHWKVSSVFFDKHLNRWIQKNCHYKYLLRWRQILLGYKTKCEHVGKNMEQDAENLPEWWGRRPLRKGSLNLISAATGENEEEEQNTHCLLMAMWPFTCGQSWEGRRGSICLEKIGAGVGCCMLAYLRLRWISLNRDE